MLKDDRRKRLTELLTTLKIEDNADLELINEALTHPSYLFDGNNGTVGHNQRLEFLGDAVVGLIVARYLFNKYPRKTEGELTKMRAAIVCEASLAHGAKDLNLGEYLQLGKGEELMGGANRTSNLADCFEAFVGALYLSTGLSEVQELILKALKCKIHDAVNGKIGDYKTQLQEFIQRSPDNNLAYKIVHEEGPDHKKSFLAAVYLNNQEIAQGRGNTKKAAEQQAAKSALNKLRNL